jgi:hypothetical protein
MRRQDKKDETKILGATDSGAALGKREEAACFLKKMKF